MDEPRATLTQRRGWFKRVELSLQDEDLFVRYLEGRNEYPRRIPLEDVNPYTAEATERRRGLKYASITAFIVAGTLGVVALAGEAGRDRAWVYVALGLAAAAWLALTLAWFLKSADFVYLYERRSGDLIVPIACDRPTREEVGEFLEKLMAAAEDRYDLSGEEWYTPSAYRTACELENAYASLQAGTLDRETFGARKRALLLAFLSGSSGRTYDERKPLAEITQRQGLFKRCTYRIFPDRLERSQTGLGRRVRSFRFMTFVPEHPHKRVSPSYGLAVLATVVVYFVLLPTVAALNGPDPSGHFTWAAKTSTACGVLVMVGSFVAVWWLRRQPLYVFSYETSRSTVDGKEQTVIGWWLRDGRPSRPAVETFLKAMAKANRDFHENNMPPSEIFARFQGLHNREILTEEELLEVRARLSKQPRPRPVDTSWGITPSSN